MRSVAVVEAKSQFSALLAAVESGEEVGVTRRGRVVARLIPDTSRCPGERLRGCWQAGGLELEAPPDAPAEPLAGWD